MDTMSPKAHCCSCSSIVPRTAKTVQSEAQDTVDLMFRAFSDRTRLRILHVLRGGELCVGDIVDSLRVPQPRISRHLAYLRKANLVLVRKSGLWSRYSLAPARAVFHRKLLECLGKCFTEVPELQADEAGDEDQEIRWMLSIVLTGLQIQRLALRNLVAV